MPITKDTTLGELLNKHPQAVKILKKYMGEVGCISCPAAAMETLEMGALVHGVNKADFKKMMAELKKIK
ncbi:MAG: DUF1858 domain-containing protein [Patescibacteria group bacterium]|jgi:hybrid cluster-associated redox disulfide protein